MDIRFFKPSWFQIKTEGKIIYIDPAYLKKYHMNYAGNILFTGWPDPIDGLPDKNLEPADLILITHHHKDHCKLSTVNRLRRKETVIIAPDKCTAELGKNIVIIKPGSEIEFDTIKIKAVHAYNTLQGSSTKKQHKKNLGAGYCIITPAHTIYHAGDTDLIPEMNNLKAIDIAMFPVGGTFTMDIDEAVEAARIIKPRAVIPMHEMGADIHEFNLKILEKTSIKAVLLQNGESHHI